MVTGYRTDASGNVIGYFDLLIVPADTDNVKWIESDLLPALYVSPEQQEAELKAQIQVILDKTDSVALRCLKAGVPFPTNWQEFVATLRSLYSSGTGTIPETPAYPSGT